LDGLKKGPGHYSFEYALREHGVAITAPKDAHNHFFGQLIAAFNAGLVGPGPSERGAPQPNSLNVSKQGSKFPSLENQKLADLAFKRLGLELEPIGDEDLKRVKALGYDGGLRVTAGGAGDVGTRGPAAATIQPGDILVGLHVWPTTSMQVLAEILNRDDLAELNPLKFYVIRRVGDGTLTNPLGEKVPPEDIEVTGRVTVQIGGGFGGGGLKPTTSAKTPY
jgi:hypothetical protein